MLPVRFVYRGVQSRLPTGSSLALTSTTSLLLRSSTTLSTSFDTFNTQAAGRNHHKHPCHITTTTTTHFQPQQAAMTTIASSNQTRHSDTPRVVSEGQAPPSPPPATTTHHPRNKHTVLNTSEPTPFADMTAGVAVRSGGRCVSSRLTITSLLLPSTRTLSTLSTSFNTFNTKAAGSNPHNTITTTTPLQPQRATMTTDTAKPKPLGSIKDIPLAHHEKDAEDKVKAEKDAEDKDAEEKAKNREGI